jgi:hypothetical protein
LNDGDEQREITNAICVIRGHKQSKLSDDVVLIVKVRYPSRLAIMEFDWNLARLASRDV